MIELETPQIEPVEEVGTYAKYEVGPLQAGYGVTLGNALRRVLLSSLEGAAVTSLQIRDVYQEFSTIPGVKEDVTQIVLNVKKLRLKSFAPHPVQLKLIKEGAGQVTAADIMETADVEIVNPDQVLLTLDSDDVALEMDLTVERGVGYLAAERTDQLPIGVIPVDAIFSPVRKVNYWVENTRVGQMTNYDKLTIEIETDGTLVPEEALSRLFRLPGSFYSAPEFSWKFEVAPAGIGFLSLAFYELYEGMHAAWAAGEPVPDAWRVAMEAAAEGVRDRLVKDGDAFQIGNIQFQVWHTPGHTPEHLAYLVLDGDRPAALFSGGTLMAGGVARTDLLSPEQTEPLPPGETYVGNSPNAWSLLAASRVW